MNATLANHVKTSSRFARSANVERDRGDTAIDGYMPTSRALDVIARIANGLSDAAAGRTFSITGPHGGGKSSLAVFLDGLLAAPTTKEYKRAHAILREVDPDLDVRLRKGIEAVQASRSGFIRAFATARNEPVAATIGRALHAGACRQFGRLQTVIPAGFGANRRTASPVDVKEKVEEIARQHPVLLVIDEFGKNLEYFAASGNDGDPYLLQELAEMTQGRDPAPLVVITLQHLAFDDYVQSTSTARRREWSKIQGRFQEIPYVETPSQSRRLISSVIQQDREFQKAADQWVRDHRDALDALGLRDIADDAARALPLHPIALAVLPELCSRYGQNERTLFSFLTGTEPSAFPQYLKRTGWKPGSPVPTAGLDLLYDYFLESSGNMIGVADGASRWIEIETRIRDAAGLSPSQLKALKAIGLLNLVASGGRVRASRQLLELALKTDAEITSDIGKILASLVDAGLVTYRAFSDEYRIWRGSDYNLRQVVESCRQAYAHRSLVELLREASSLDPLVAGRHSQRTGVLRVFAREFSDGRADEPVDLDLSWDGVVFYATDPKLDPGIAPQPADGRPAIYVIPQSLKKVREAAIEAGALTLALRRAESENADWVARKELVERASAAQQKLQVAISETWNNQAGWFLAETGEPLDARQGISALLSDVADWVYSGTPKVANEMIARRELTSQGAKARRFLTDAMLKNGSLEAFGIEGYGPDRAIYEAIFRKTGMHRRADDGAWELRPPTDKSWKPVWAVMNSLFDEAVDHRVNLAEIAAVLALPPIGLKAGILPLLLITGLIARGDEIALYEHGTLVLQLDDAVAERLTKNLNHFSVRNTETRRGPRSIVVKSLIERLGISVGGRRSPTFLNVAMALFRELRTLPPYTQRTRKGVSGEAVAVRDAFHQATEPDVLIFETLPEIFGMEPFRGRGAIRQQLADQFADQLAGAIRELRYAYPRLLEKVRKDLAHATSTFGGLAEMRRVLAADAQRLAGHVLEPKLRAFVGALARELGDQEWLENVAMVVCDGQGPRAWTDELAGLFPLRVAEVGGALRRTSALLHDRLAAEVEQGFTPIRMTLTRPDGRETVELLALTETERAMIDGHFDELLAKLTNDGLSRSAACRMLMARLALEHDEPAELPDRELSRGGKERRYG